jgi:hypothetical protein
MSQIEFHVPKPDEGGYPRRLYLALKHQEMLGKWGTKEMTHEVFEEMMDFLCEFVVSPEDKDEAKEALFDATEDQFNELLEAVMGYWIEGQVPKNK